MFGLLKSKEEKEQENQKKLAEKLKKYMDA